MPSVKTGHAYFESRWDHLRVLANGKYWFMLYRYDPWWDSRIRHLARNFVFDIPEEGDPEDGYIVRLAHEKIWISNHPYASFVPYPDGGMNKEKIPRPSRVTIYRLKRKLDIERATATRS